MRSLVITVASAIAVLGGLEWSASRVHGGNQDTDAAPPWNRAPNVVVLPKRVEAHPPPVSITGSSVLLVGNSHTYALPSMTKGGDLRPDPGATLIDELARRIADRGSKQPVTFYRLAYPNFLPLEVFTRLGQLTDLGYRPTIVLIGVAWSNLARGASLRSSIRGLYQDPEFAARRVAELERVGAAPRVIAAVQANRRREMHTVEEQRMQSAADRIDDQLTEYAGRRVSLLGESRAIRARIYRDFAYGVDALIYKSGSGQPNDVVADELELNLQVMSVINALLTQRGVKVVVYASPERGDLPPLVDQSRRAASMRWLAAELAKRGSVLLDASKVVPDDMFGWEHDTPDRSHFTEPGHAVLAKFLIDGAVQHGSLDTLVAFR